MSGTGQTRPGVTLRLLDRHQQPVPAGVTGEIFVDGLQEGSPFKTGDLGRQHHDGSVEWLGPR